MKRSWLVVLAVALIAVPAAVLRVRSGLRQAALREGTMLPTEPTPVPSTSARPHDYVAHPVVAPGEETRGPRRIVSLAPSITEIVCALGMRDRLAGRTPYCTWPPGIEKVQEVGALLDANYEMIKAINPELVLITANSRGVAASLEKLGLPFAAIPHDTLEEVYTGIHQIGSLCDRPRTAAALVEAIRADIDRVRDARRTSAHGVRAIVVLGALPVPPQGVFAAGPGSFLETMLQMAGGTNAAREALAASHGEIPLEKLLFVDPEVILEFREPVRPDATRDLYQAWSQVELPHDDSARAMRAIDRRQVRSIGGLEWLSAGPRIAIELHRFAEVLAEFD